MTNSDQSSCGSKQWSRVSFSVFSDDLTPTEISEILAQEPSWSHCKGDPVSPRKPQGPFRNQNHWSITFDTDTELPFEDHLKCILEFIEEKAAEISMLQTRCEMRIFGSSTVTHRSGFDLSVEEIELLARAKVSLGFDLKAPTVL